jgi:macrocin-O-methyltransferase TylF-like protien
VINRGKTWLRDKVVGATREAVLSTGPEETRDLVRSVLEQLREDRDAAAQRAAELEKQLAEVSAELGIVRAAVAGFEHRQRRDIAYGAEAAALAETTRFVLDEMPALPRFPSPHDTLRHGLSLLGDQPGMALEFGVGEGSTLRIIAEHCPGRLVAGFDVFTGLPETWRSDFPAGHFAQEALPEVPGAELVVGLFEDTLPGFLEQHGDTIAFLHLDADLYSSTRTVLDAAGSRLRGGSVVVFDEYFNYPGWQDHEHKAWLEFVARTGVTYRWEGYSVDHEQVVATVLGTPWD